MALTSNWCRCTSCHPGYGWKDDGFDFQDQQAVDCLICHEQSGTYKKFPAGCGEPPYQEKKFAGKTFEPVDLAKAAKSVGPTSRRSCGSCHFYSGGGDGVKRGDMDSSLAAPPKELDVHMDAKGLDFACTTCHTTFAHEIDGRHYDEPAPGKPMFALPKDDGHRIRCESCHGTSPHATTPILNGHTRRIACETCHVPSFGRGRPTKVWWDWSTAGRFGPNHSLIVEKGPLGRPTYHTKKGTMRWAKEAIPEYLWYDGTMSYTRMGERVEPQGEDGIVWLNRPNGNPSDPDSKIFPFKVHMGRQPYDPENRLLIVPKLFGKKGSGAFWAEYDWKAAAAAGMKAAGLPFSGEVAFVTTRYHLPLAHMVPPKEKALACKECHVRQGSRLANVQGIYIPGRDRFGLLDQIGWGMILTVFAATVLHGAMRMVKARRRPPKH